MSTVVSEPVDGAAVETSAIWGRLSYSQEGEDLVLARFLGLPWDRSGFYVDVGAHHPWRFSNTHYYYCLGWRGINIEPMPDAVRLFDKHRPGDINLGVGVSGRPGQMSYFSMSEPALNTFCKDLALFYQQQGFAITGEFPVFTTPLKLLLERHLPEDVRVIDFLNVDVEGFDLQVLQSNDWDRFRPRFVLAEELNIPTLRGVFETTVSQYLANQGYHPVAKTFNTVIFAERSPASV